MIKNIKIVNQISEQDLNYIIESFIANKIHNSFEHIGSGSYGKVYRYNDYAIKLFIENDGLKESNDPYILENLQNYEGYPILYFYAKDLFMVTEYIEGATYSELIFSTITPLEESIYLIENHIKYAQQQNIIVDDLNADNIIFNKEGYPIIIDVGSFEFITKNTSSQYRISKQNEIEQQIRQLINIENRAWKFKKRNNMIT